MIPKDLVGKTFRNHSEGSSYFSKCGGPEAPPKCTGWAVCGSKKGTHSAFRKKVLDESEVKMKRVKKNSHVTWKIFN